MKFKKIYIEITNVCNFSCSFCFKSNRKKTFISPEVFSAILFSIKPYTDYLYLHVLGEPLLHPQLSILLNMAEQQGFFVNLTTNGSLLLKQNDVLSSHRIRQYNISLHDAEENIPSDGWINHWKNLCDFASLHSNDSYFSFRLWNIGVESSLYYNQQCVSFLEQYFGLSIQKGSRNIKLSDHIFLQYSDRFSWPGNVKLNLRRKRCYALKDHVAILVDGTVVPCCLDADGKMALGNILNQKFEEIIFSEKSQSIKEGFIHNQIVDPLCKDCGFILP